MNATTHRLYITTLVSINLALLIYLVYQGFSYYNTPLVERFYHEDHSRLKPSGAIGHGYGIVGTLLILIGVFSYIARKKFKSWSGLGRLKYWLEFHIFLCTMGPMLVLFHTAFKFGGLVSISFWSMIAVVASGIIGRFIYIQIPRSIEGRELNLAEANALKQNIGELLKSQYHLDDQTIQEINIILQRKHEDHSKYTFYRLIRQWIFNRKQLAESKNILRKAGLQTSDWKKLLKIVKQEIKLQRKIEHLLFMQKIFRYWHVAHLPFAFIMLIIMVIHVIVTLMFGYRWIF